MVQPNDAADEVEGDLMLEVRHLTRRFGDLIAVDDVSFQVPAGQMIGFVGGNGAGKTTTMRMIMGLLSPSSGEVLWDGSPITTQIRSKIGYMPEERGLYPKQGVLDQLTYLGQLKGSSKQAANAEASELLARFGLAERTEEKLEKLSLGNQQRVQIAASLLAKPVALILDEPFSGLDPKGIDEMAGLLADEAARGVPVLFSSHQLDLIDRLCDGLVILASGKVVAKGTKDELESHGPLRHRLVVDGDAGWLRGMPDVEVDSLDGGTALLRLQRSGMESQLLQQALQRGNVLEFAQVRPTLSEIYREVTA